MSGMPHPSMMRLKVPGDAFLWQVPDGSFRRQAVVLAPIGAGMTAVSVDKRSRTLHLTREMTSSIHDEGGDDVRI